MFFNEGFVVYGLLRRFTPRNDSTHKLVIARVAFATRGNLSYSRLSLWRPKACGNLGILGSSLREPKVRGNLGILGSSLRDFAEIVAISFIPGSSLRRPKACGNLDIGHNYSIDEFFSLLFLVVVLWFVDCFTSFAMTKGKRGGEFFLFSVFAFLLVVNFFYFIKIAKKLFLFHINNYLII